MMMQMAVSALLLMGFTRIVVNVLAGVESKFLRSLGIWFIILAWISTFVWFAIVGEGPPWN